MNSARYIRRVILFAVICLAGVSAAIFAQTTENDAERPTPSKRGAARFQVEEKDRVPLEVAKDRAQLMHDIYSVTLDVIHHRYFHREKSVIPARAMEDVFNEMRRQYKVDANWISVNLKAMSVDHDPKTDFEKKAAEELATGKADYDSIEAGYYRRATSIPLGSGCITCHSGFFKDPTSTPKYAGLVISIPIQNSAPVENPGK